MMTAFWNNLKPGTEQTMVSQGGQIVPGSYLYIVSLLKDRQISQTYSKDHLCIKTTCL